MVFGLLFVQFVRSFLSVIKPAMASIIAPMPIAIWCAVMRVMPINKQATLIASIIHAITCVMLFIIFPINYNCRSLQQGDALLRHR